MNKPVLLPATGVLALTAGSAIAGSRPSVAVKPTNVHPIQARASILYTQNSNFGYGIDSQNFTSGTYSPTYNSAAADDFVIPKGKIWKVTEIDVTGVYFNG